MAEKRDAVSARGSSLSSCPARAAPHSRLRLRLRPLREGSPVCMLFWHAYVCAHVATGGASLLTALASRHTLSTSGPVSTCAGTGRVRGDRAERSEPLDQRSLRGESRVEASEQARIIGHHRGVARVEARGRLRARQHPRRAVGTERASPRAARN
eukprot:2442878-Prymnesium_polylepis.1